MNMERLAALLSGTAAGLIGQLLDLGFWRGLLVTMLLLVVVNGSAFAFTVNLEDRRP